MQYDLKLSEFSNSNKDNMRDANEYKSKFKLEQIQTHTHYYRYTILVIVKYILLF